MSRRPMAGATGARLDLEPAPEWFARAACHGIGPAMFFGSEAEQDDTVTNVCEGCPTRLDCVDHAVTNRIPDGVWGSTEKQRRRLKRPQRRNALRAGARPADVVIGYDPPREATG